MQKLVKIICDDFVGISMIYWNTKFVRTIFEDAWNILWQEIDKLM